MFPIRRYFGGGRHLDLRLPFKKGLVRDLVFPRLCPGCRGPGGDFFLCTRCRAQLIPFEAPHCTACGRAFPRGGTDSHLCPDCLNQTPCISHVRAAFVYRDLLKVLLPRFKYTARFSMVKGFERALFQAFEAQFDPPPDCLIPIPLHPRRLCQRGFNQAYVLMRHFPEFYRQAHGGEPPWEILTRTLVRLRHTPPQTGFDPKARRQNIQGAFGLDRPHDVQDRHILLVDDVYTTGATANEAARILLAAGAARVDALVLARA